MAFISRPTEEQRAQEAQQRQAEQAAQQAAQQAQWDAQYLTPPARVTGLPTWEYKHVFFGTGTEHHHITRALNIMGGQGWELVTMDVERNQRIIGAPAQSTLVLKRRSG